MAEITCTVLYASDFNVLWVKVDKQMLTEPVILSSGSTIVIRDSRLSVKQDKNCSSSTLQVPCTV